MGNYLYEYSDGGSTYTTKIVEDIRTRHQINVTEFDRRLHINSFMEVNYMSEEYRGLCHIGISEYPGNCSSLILHNVETLASFHQSTMKHFLDFAEELGKALGYGALWVTGVNDSAQKFFCDNGFKIVASIHNPHSGRENYFVVKDINK
jgi:hypothetical protein